MALSTARSSWERWELGSYDFSFSTVISPERQNVKNVVVDAAHNIRSSAECSLLSHTPLSLRRIIGVIGRRKRDGFPCVPASILTPFKTYEVWPSDLCGGLVSHVPFEFVGPPRGKSLWLNALDPVGLSMPQNNRANFLR